MSTGSSLFATPLIRFSGDAPTTRRLYCFPFAGGSAATFRTWHLTLPLGTEVAMLRFPGREPGHPAAPLSSIAAMTDFAVAAVQAENDAPYALFGHSMGAAVAYEVASSLERSGGHGPEHLFVSARKSPGAPLGRDPVHRLPDEQFIEAIEARYGGISPVVRNEPDLLRMYMGILRADVTAFETYEQLADHRVRCPVTAFGGREDAHPLPADLIGWADVATEPVTTCLFPGDHFYINDQAIAITARIASLWNSPRAAA